MGIIIEKSLSDFILFDDIYRDKHVLVTGHTGFKGSWLCMWLKAMGANILGYSLHPNTKPNHFCLLERKLKMQSIIGDILDLENLKKTFANFKPEIVFHLAAQPLVLLSYDNPLETLKTNIMGTTHVFEACRSTKSVQAIINITSDKCYENLESFWGCRENDPMGGHDPYSVSKACSELITSAYRNSFFNSHNVLLASVRAGNVIGGGDWARNRIVSDMMKAANNGTKLHIRKPQAIRPWQHVLEPLAGYLYLGQKLLEGKKKFAEGWNFGPNDDDTYSVLQLVQQMQKCWHKIEYKLEENKNNPYEVEILKLNCSKAKTKLQWKAVWDTMTACVKTAEWYKTYYELGINISIPQLQSYIQDGKNIRSVWVKEKIKSDRKNKA